MTIACHIILDEAQTRKKKISMKNVSGALTKFEHGGGLGSEIVAMFSLQTLIFVPCSQEMILH